MKPVYCPFTENLFRGPRGKHLRVKEFLKVVVQECPAEPGSQLLLSCVFYSEHLHLSPPFQS